METHFESNYHGQRGHGDLSRDDLIHNVMMLRQDFDSMATDMRAVMEENVQLKEKLNELQGNRQRKPDSVSEIKRLKQDLDNLLNMHRTRRSAPPSGMGQMIPQVEESPRGSGGNDWLRKMMMVMMISDLV